MVRTRFVLAGIQPLRQLAVIIAVTALTSCALDAPSTSLDVRIPDLRTSARSDAGLLRLGQGSMAFDVPSGMTSPTSWDQFTCFGVMVSAADIPATPVCPNYAPGAGMPAKPGVFGGLVPSSGGRITTSVSTGPGRRVQLFGLMSKRAGEACPSLGTIIAESNSGIQGNTGDPVELATQNVDVFSDTTVTLTPQFNPLLADQKVIFKCGGGSNGTQFGPNSVTGLVLWLDAGNPGSPYTDGTNPGSWSDRTILGHSVSAGGSPLPVYCSTGTCGGVIPLPNGKPFMKFGGGSSNFTSSGWSGDPAMNSPGRTVIAVNYVPTGQAVNNIIYAESYNNGASAVSGCPSGPCNNFMKMGWMYPAGNFQAQSIFDTSGTTLNAVQSVGTGVWHVTSMVRRSAAGGTIDIYTDGAIGSGSSGLNNAPSNLVKVVIGADGITSNALNGGGIAEILVYSSEISDQQREKLECQLRDKYGIPGGSFGSNYGCNY